MTKDRLKVLRSVINCLSHHLSIKDKDGKLSMTACGGCDEYILCRDLFRKINEKVGDK